MPVVGVPPSWMVSVQVAASPSVATGAVVDTVVAALSIRNSVTVPLSVASAR